MRANDGSQDLATMSELGRYLATYYLPHVHGDVLESYGSFIEPSVSAGHMAHMHLHMWRMALMDAAYDLQRVRATLLRRHVSPTRLTAIDDLVVRRLGQLICTFGADRQQALHTEVAMALAAMDVACAMSSAA